VLQTVTEGGAEPFVPQISITVALVLTLVSLARHAGMVERACRRTIPERQDRADAERWLRRLDAALAGRLDQGTATPARLA
jgi:uncharacterized membrane protein